MNLDFPRTEQLPGLKTLWRLAFGDTEAFLAHFFTTAYSPDRCRCAVAEGEVLAALYWLDGEYRGRKIAYIYAVATHPDHRGKGLCRRLMADTHSLLKAKGYAAALLTPAEPGLRRMYAAMGYRDCCGISELACLPGEAVSLHPVTGAQYGALRRRYLPEEGLVQEGENLRFLEGYCGLWAGEDFLLAADVREGTLRGLELLGNVQAASGILTALNCREGTFRVPGKDIPFSMGYPLALDAALPGYLGLAFD